LRAAACVSGSLSWRISKFGNVSINQRAGARVGDKKYLAQHDGKNGAASAATAAEGSAHRAKTVREYHSSLYGGLGDATT